MREGEYLTLLNSKDLHNMTAKGYKYRRTAQSFSEMFILLISIMLRTQNEKIDIHTATHDYSKKKVSLNESTYERSL